MRVRVNRLRAEASPTRARRAGARSTAWLAVWLSLSLGAAAPGGEPVVGDREALPPGDEVDLVALAISKTRVRSYTEESFSLLADFGPADANELRSELGLGGLPAQPALLGLRRRPRQAELGAGAAGRRGSQGRGGRGCRLRARFEALGRARFRSRLPDQFGRRERPAGVRLPLEDPRWHAAGDERHRSVVRPGRIGALRLARARSSISIGRWRPRKAAGRTRSMRAPPRWAGSSSNTSSDGAAGSTG